MLCAFCLEANGRDDRCGSGCVISHTDVVTRGVQISLTTTTTTVIVIMAVIPSSFCCYCCFLPCFVLRCRCTENHSFHYHHKRGVYRLIRDGGRQAVALKCVLQIIKRHHRAAS
uniref:Uncharacterized protein n=1 Tax=Trypanosoma vivax (strain Y486) TaxID=1055687 RepID=G0U626_TRYVY|nr:hypothetical protein TVY486_1003800 [Trypanosoma vivax Y486]